MWWTILSVKFCVNLSRNDFPEVVFQFDAFSCNFCTALCASSLAQIFSSFVCLFWLFSDIIRIQYQTGFVTLPFLGDQIRPWDISSLLPCSHQCPWASVCTVLYTKNPNQNLVWLFLQWPHLDDEWNIYMIFPLALGWTPQDYHKISISLRGPHTNILNLIIFLDYIQTFTEISGIVSCEKCGILYGVAFYDCFKMASSSIKNRSID